jgi:hypothetical protein
MDADQHNNAQHAHAHVSQGEQRSASRRPSEHHDNMHSSLRNMDTGLGVGNRADSNNMHSSMRSLDAGFPGGNRTDNNFSRASSVLSSLSPQRERDVTNMNSSFTRGRGENNGMRRSSSGGNIRRLSGVYAQDTSKPLDFDRDFDLLQEDETEVALTDHDTDFLRALRPVLHGLYLISKHSSHYNTPQRVSELIRAVCNVTTARAREHVFGQSGNAALLHDFAGASVRLRWVIYIYIYICVCVCVCG